METAVRLTAVVVGWSVRGSRLTERTASWRTRYATNWTTSCSSLYNRSTNVTVHFSLKITLTTVDKIADSHEPFSGPQSCRSNEGRALSPPQWKEDLEELQAAGSAPSQDAVASSSRAIIGRIGELMNTIEVDSFKSSSDVKAHRALEKGLTKTDASFAMLSEIRHTAQRCAPRALAALKKHGASTSSSSKSVQRPTSESSV